MYGVSHEMGATHILPEGETREAHISWDTPYTHTHLSLLDA